MQRLSRHNIKMVVQETRSYKRNSQLSIFANSRHQHIGESQAQSRYCQRATGVPQLIFRQNKVAALRMLRSSVDKFVLSKPIKAWREKFCQRLTKMQAFLLSTQTQSYTLQSLRSWTTLEARSLSLIQASSTAMIHLSNASFQKRFWLKTLLWLGLLRLTQSWQAVELQKSKQRRQRSKPKANTVAKVEVAQSWVTAKPLKCLLPRSVLTTHFQIYKLTHRRLDVRASQAVASHSQSCRCRLLQSLWRTQLDVYRSARKRTLWSKQVVQTHTNKEQANRTLTMIELRWLARTITTRSWLR